MAAIALPCWGRAGSRQHPIRKYSRASNAGLRSLSHLATSRNVPLDYWWSAGTAPLLVIQGLDDEAAPPGNGHALREQSGERVQVVDLPHAGHFLLLEQPEAVARAVSEFLGRQRSGLMTPH